MLSAHSPSPRQYRAGGYDDNGVNPPGGGRGAHPPEGTFYHLGQTERDTQARQGWGREGAPAHLGALSEHPPPRDIDFDRANETLRQMRAPGCSELTAVQTYNCLDQLGLTKNIDVPRHFMRAAAAAAAAAGAREAQEVAAASTAARRITASLAARDVLGAEESKLSAAGGGKAKGGGGGGVDGGDVGEGVSGGGPLSKRRSVTESKPPTTASKATTLPKGLTYRAPIEHLQRSAGLRKAIAHEIIRFSVDREEMLALNGRVKQYHREKAANMHTDFCALHRMAIDGYDATVAAETIEVRREERERRGELVRERRAEVLRTLAARETRAEASERRRATAADLACRQSQQRKLMALVALHSRLKHAWREVLVIRTVHKIHISQARASRVVQKHWRGYCARARFQRMQRALTLIQPRVRLWCHRRKLRDGANHIREFLEKMAAGNEVVRRLQALRRACATIQAAFRAAFRTMSDQLDMFVVHWNCYEQYIHMTRADTARRKEGTTEQKRFKGGFRLTYAGEFDELDSRLRIPEAIKLKLVAKFLKAKRKQRTKHYEAYLAQVEDWKLHSRQDAKLEMAKSVMEGKSVVLEEVEARIMAKKPQRKWRRILMTIDEISKLHMEGEKTWQDEMAFQDDVFGALNRLGRSKSTKSGLLSQAGKSEVLP